VKNVLDTYVAPSEHPASPSVSSGLYVSMSQSKSHSLRSYAGLVQFYKAKR